MIKLREGEEYLFLVEKEFVTPDKTTHFILSGPDKSKFLLPAETYSDYNIIVGQSLKCRIDRVNCKGKVFLEPRHPIYSEGKSYFFEVVEVTTRLDKTGNEVNAVVVKDNWGNRAAIPSGNITAMPGSKLKLKIERISKGKLFLIPDQGRRCKLKIRSGRFYEFIVEKIARGLDEKEYYVIRDPAGDTHMLARKYYEYYGLKPGHKFKGKIAKYRKNGEKIIEPENPFYRIGEVLTLKLSGTNRNVINDTFTLDLIDKFGFRYCIESTILPDKKNVRCRVTMIKKGKPLLELL
jgi:hypothetical protein